MVDTEPSGSETNLVLHSAQYTCGAQMSSKESKEIVFHNAEPWYLAKFGLAKKERRSIRVLGVQVIDYEELSGVRRSLYHAARLHTKVCWLL
jgi:hypothetical protein